jgi:hypothetical protein
MKKAKRPSLFSDKPGFLTINAQGEIIRVVPHVKLYVKILSFVLLLICIFFVALPQLLWDDIIEPRLRL